MNSVVQTLLGGTVPELVSRYGLPAGGDVTAHPLLEGINPQSASLDLLAQTAKLGCALTSGTYAGPAPDSATVSDVRSPSNDPRYRLTPRMFKHCVGKDHQDFRTGRQQDASQYLQYLLERLDRAEMGAGRRLVNKSDESASLLLSSGLFAFRTRSRLVCQADGGIKYKEGAPETVLSLRIPLDKSVGAEKSDESEGNSESGGGDESAPEIKRHKSEMGDGKDKEKERGEEKEKEKKIPVVSLRSCLESWASPHTIEGLRWSHLGDKVHPATEEIGFSTFPRYLMVQAQRYELGPDWTPRKLEVNLDVPLELDLNEFRSGGPREGENLVSEELARDDTDNSSSAAVGAVALSPPSINEVALSQLMDMGFSCNGCSRALTKVGGSDVEAAMNWIFEHNTDPDFNDPLPQSNTGGKSTSAGGGGGAESETELDDGVVMSLVDSLGCFTTDQVRAALKNTGGAADRAADWLFSHMVSYSRPGSFPPCGLLCVCSPCPVIACILVQS